MILTRSLNSIDSTAAGTVMRMHKGFSSTADDYDVIVVGAGQAGLAAGYYLRRSGLRFIIVDAAAELGASWRNRWDSLRLFTPSRYSALPGMRFPADDYDVPDKEQVAGYLRAYAEQFALPIRMSTHVAALRLDHDQFVLVTTSGATFRSSAVIVATGANQRPYTPGFAAAVSPNILQLHSHDYRRPDQLPRGKILVVGAGNSGVQIALDLRGSGRSVTLAGRETGSIPRRLLGRDIYDWLWPTIMRPSVDSTVGRRLMQGKLFRGDPLIGISPGWVEQELTRVGRIAGVRGGQPTTEAGEVIDDLAAIVWCTGFRPDYAWIEMPTLGLDGYPRHRRGMAIDAPGLSFLGMRFQYRMGSALLGGVAEDAEYIVDQVSRHVRGG